MSALTSVGILGANGYGGGEVARLLSAHPNVRLSGLSSRQYEGKPFGAAWPGADLEAVFETAEAVADRSEIVILALPNGLAMELAPGLLAAGKRVIDLSADYRLDPAAYQVWYGKGHASPGLCEEAVYGLPELDRAGHAGARLIANPGCYVTAATLALMPLAREGLLGGSAIADGVSGISGAGRNAAEYSFAEANENVQAYKVGGQHRHTPEIERNLLSAGEGAIVTFTPRVAPLTRGILLAAYATPPQPLTPGELGALYHDTYEGEPFVRVVAEPPPTKAVVGTNRCDVYVRLDERAGRVVAVAALDNLVKGMAGAVVQNLNLMLGLPETIALPTWSPWP